MGLTRHESHSGNMASPTKLLVKDNLLNPDSSPNSSILGSSQATFMPVQQGLKVPTTVPSFYTHIFSEHQPLTKSHGLAAALGESAQSLISPSQGGKNNSGPKFDASSKWRITNKNMGPFMEHRPGLADPVSNGRSFMAIT
eukprot:TRINITY_DN14382_c0_g1_i1.p2 TRINITY_DN14382_c0_g1~~TRINITY_DN14382_c0_g1_i1.p2  ORF type:complete len:141 (+),score=21.09 TRINITY_DN14382_c0_g1_i1:304-726(+)